jgi:hypothetical protein
MQIMALDGRGHRLRELIALRSEIMTKRQRLIASLAGALMIGAASGTIAAAHDRDPGPGTMSHGPYYWTDPGYGIGPGMMGPGYGMMGPGQQQWRMGPGMMGPGYQMGQGMMGQGYHMGPGMMGPGYGMMGPGQGQGQGRMGPGYGTGPHYGMGPGMMGPGMMEPGYGMGSGRQAWEGPRVTPRMNLSTDDVRAFFEEQLAAEGNDRLEVGKVEALDDDTIRAEIVTVDGSLVASYQVDRHSGAIAPAG